MNCSKDLKWKKVGNKQYEAVSKNKKYDFVYDGRDPKVLLVFNNKIKDKDKAFIDSVEVDNYKEAQCEAAGWV